MAQCDREISGSSISTSAPPPIRPIVVIELVISNSPPCDGPSTTQTLKCSPAGLAAAGNRVSDNPMGLGLSRGSDDGTRLVGGPGIKEMEPCSMVDWHIQQVTADEGALSK